MDWTIDYFEQENGVQPVVTEYPVSSIQIDDVKATVGCISVRVGLSMFIHLML